MKKHYFITFMFLGSLAATSLAQAKDNTQSDTLIQYSKTYTRCVDQSGGVTSTMLSCINQETIIQDKRLNTAYQQLTKLLIPAQRSTLQSAQRSWLTTRKSTCDFYSQVSGGSMSTLISQDCFLQETARRAGLLNYWLDLAKSQ